MWKTHFGKSSLVAAGKKLVKKEGRLASEKNCSEAPALLHSQAKLSLKEVVHLSPSWWMGAESR